MKCQKCTPIDDNKTVNTLIQMCIVFLRDPCFLHIVFVIGRSVLAKGSAIQPIGNDFSRKLKSDGLYNFSASGVLSGLVAKPYLTQCLGLF